MALRRQIRTLIFKNFRILLCRHLFKVLMMGFVVPILLAAVFSFAKNLFVPPAVYGFGQVRPIRTLAEGYSAAAGRGRDKVVLIDNGHTGGDIERVLDLFEAQIHSASPRMNVVRAHDMSVLVRECRSTLRGVTSCFNAVAMVSSPEEGPMPLWNYTIRTDAEMSRAPIRVRIDRSDNPEEIFVLPTQRAIDGIIASLKTPHAPDVLSRSQELAFTSLTQKQRDAKVRQIFHTAIINFMGVAFLTNILWVSYHLPGFVATERETGMSQLIDAMMPVAKPWMSLAARITSSHISFTMIYAPAWIFGSLIVRVGVFPNTSFGIVVILYLLGGMGITSLSILFASFFKKSQLSGISAILTIALLGILAQSLTKPPTAAVAILSFLFTPCAFTYFITLMSWFEKANRPANLIEIPPKSPWKIPGIVLLAFIMIHIIVYPLLAAMVEKGLYGVATEGRKVETRQPDAGEDHSEYAVKLESFTKVYAPSIFSKLLALGSKPSQPVVAVNDLSFNVRKGEIVVLLGANGSGKSTTLDSIAGLNKLSSGSIVVDGTRGLGIAPQKNVIWDDLTVQEHLEIFDELKSPLIRASHDAIVETINSIDLSRKRFALAKTLSGGQKRKLQLGMMLVGGSAVCCVDEVSSGIDPLSRRKIWDILLAERGRRSIIMTTHFLDEADLLADHIAILSRGTLRAQGSSAELKDRLGGGYRVSVYKSTSLAELPSFQEVKKEDAFDQVTYVAPTSNLAAQVIRELQNAEITDYSFSSPTIENVFLQLAEELRDEASSGETCHSLVPSMDTLVCEKVVEMDNPTEQPAESGFRLLDGRQINCAEQTVILLKKRWTILKRNWVLYFIAFLLPIAAAGLTSLYVKGARPMGCATDQVSSSMSKDGFSQMGAAFNPAHFHLPAGPKSSFDIASLIAGAIPFLVDSPLAIPMVIMLKNIELFESFDEFQQYTKDHSGNVTTGLWLGDATSKPTIAWAANLVFTNPMTAQQLLNLMLTNTTVQTTWTPFEVPFNPELGKSLNLVVYMGLALVFYPAFFALYPSNERRSFVRSLQYSNGVQPLPLWIAYVVFDFSIVLVCMGVVTALYAGLSKIWFHIEYVFVVLFLYGLASVLVAYLVSLFAKSQLATFAWAVFGQAVGFLAYLFSYMSIATFVPASRIDSSLLVCHFIISALLPMGSAMRALFLTTNLFSTACDDTKLSTRPMAMTQFGGPILFLVLQSCALFGLLIWIDSGSAGFSMRTLFTRHWPVQQSDHELDTELANELNRVENEKEEEKDGLKLLHVTKSFGKNTAVDDVTFGVKESEVFALLGPNGAGKSTTISLIRGDTKPSVGSGDIFIKQSSITKHLRAARASLGVCPQIDALDQMTVQEHLEFYARVRGIPDIRHNVEAVLQAVGLTSFSARMASALSGGNKRKLSLGIALMGNPAVVLLDEPSSGLDAAAKRIMWKTLKATVAGRSILLTTHSMEEADALANRVGILARRMLALGSPDELRHRFGDLLHVHLVSTSAPRTTDEEMGAIVDWILSVLPTAFVETKTYHGQMRFSVKGEDVLAATSGAIERAASKVGHRISHTALGRLIVLLEENKERLGVQHYTVSPTTLDQVFLTIVGEHQVHEEGYEERRPSRVRRMVKFWHW